MAPPITTNTLAIVTRTTDPPIRTSEHPMRGRLRKAAGAKAASIDDESWSLRRERRVASGTQRVAGAGPVQLFPLWAGPVPPAPAKGTRGSPGRAPAESMKVGRRVRPAYCGCLVERSDRRDLAWRRGTDVDPRLCAECVDDLGVDVGVPPQAVAINPCSWGWQVALEAVDPLVPLVVDEHGAVLRCVERVVAVPCKLAAVDPHADDRALPIIVVADVQPVNLVSAVQCVHSRRLQADPFSGHGLRVGSRHRDVRAGRGGVDPPKGPRVNPLHHPYAAYPHAVLRNYR